EPTRVKTTGLAETCVKQRLAISQRKHDVERVNPLIPMVRHIQPKVYHNYTKRQLKRPPDAGTIGYQRVISVVFALPRWRAVGTFNGNARIFP
ncbi:MAG TPA: hypothetical protein VNZ25_08560, partial [Candidatus Angelobacter sp.]|nr:hypothetical protein [Candidatus Angelobacter sp.]